jgi:hypothetical protein
MIVKLAGTTFADCQDNIKKYGSNEVLYYALVREPDNLHDTNAIKVMLGDNCLGYIPRDVASSLAPQMDHGKNLVAEFVQVNESPFHGTVGITIRIIEI